MKTTDLVSTEASRLWKESLKGKLPSDWEKDIDNFETDIVLKKKGKVDDKLFAETRLRMGAYGQRYDNGHRYDGKENRAIPFENNFKGPGTFWDAPGMERIKLPWGGMTADQIDLFADLSEEYSDGISHITTRQDIQLHYVHIENCPSMFRRLAALNITTKEACGNSIRNVTACPISGVCRDENFDVTPYAQAVFEYLLGHPDVQDFGRKFKIALSGCKTNPCGLTNIHDLGLIAVVKKENGQVKRGFEFYVGGGLGAVTYDAKLFSDFVPEEEVLGLTQAVCRVFARLGEKKKRHRARIKFLVADMGLDAFREEVLKERAKLPVDPRWTEYLSSLNKLDEAPLKPAGGNIPEVADAPFKLWVKTNIYHQRQPGYVVVTVCCPLGDLSPNQMRAVADIARKYVKDTVRTTVEQNLVLRWVRECDVYEVYQALKAVGLGEPGAESILDITACPGTDTCKLGISSSRGLAGELRTRLAERFSEMDEAVQDLRIKVSGCFNSCGQQHIADIGFYGISRNVGGYVVPHFQMVLGGEFGNNGSPYGLAVGGLPSKAIPNAVDKITEMFLEAKKPGERFRAWVERVGKSSIMLGIADLITVPSYEKDKSFYVDWGDIREYSVKDKGIGECAGELVTLTEFGLKAADREVFEAQVQFDAGKFDVAAKRAYQAMVFAAQGLIKIHNIDISDDPDQVMKEFRQYFYDTQVFNDPYAGPKFALYYFQAHEKRMDSRNKDQANAFLQEAQLFIEASHSCYARLSLAPKNDVLTLGKKV